MNEMNPEFDYSIIKWGVWGGGTHITAQGEDWWAMTEIIKFIMLSSKKK